MGIAGAALLAFAPDDAAIDALGWVWPALFLAVLAATVVRVRVSLHSRARNTAFEGRKFSGFAKMTFVGGACVFDRR